MEGALRVRSYGVRVASQRPPPITESGAVTAITADVPVSLPLTSRPTLRHISWGEPAGASMSE